MRRRGRTIIIICCVLAVIFVLHELLAISPTNCVALLSRRLNGGSAFGAAQRRRSHRRRRRRLPNALLIGVRKGGTRALIDALSMHPKIRAARHELHFFDDDKNYDRGLEWYRAQMPTTSDDQVSKRIIFVSHFAK